MDFFTIVYFFGGLGLFIFGMMIMGQSLEKIAGNKLSDIIAKLTGNRFKGVLCGALVAGIIQSSSVTTVMVVGFVNAGIMKLTQAVGVIMGANIGTTITAQLIGFNTISADNFILKLLKPSSLAPIAIAVGICMYLISKKRKMIELGEVLIGFGILFAGMQTMESAVKSLSSLPEFRQVFLMFTNPVVGVLIGAAVTGIIQSSSASVGILQAFAASGLVTFSSAAPIIMGQNIGTCVTALLSSIGANKTARKAALIHLYFNVIGTAVFLAAIYLFQTFIGFPFWQKYINAQDIANFHTVFNITNTIVLLPFSNLLVKLANMTIKTTPAEAEITTKLDERLLSVPAMAIEQVKDLVFSMFLLAKENIILGRSAVAEKKRDVITKILENENIIDKMEFDISKYLVKITDQELDEQESTTVSVLFKTVNDIERISDHAVNLSEIATNIIDNKIDYSKTAHDELNVMFDACTEIIDITLESYKQNQESIATKVEPLEEIVDMLRDTLRSNHISRLTSGDCSVETGVSYLEIINNLERVADHCSNIAIGVFQNNDITNNIDPHNYINKIKTSPTGEYTSYMEFYKTKYYNKIN